MVALADAKLVFLDVETTGLYQAMGDRVVEIGLVVCGGRDVVGEFTQLFDPEREIPVEARQVHGIADDEVVGCPVFRSCAVRVAMLLDGAWVVGHNVAFDVGFVGMELMVAGVTATPAGCLDTRQLAAAMWDLPDYKLGTVAESLGETAARHRALGDARATRTIFHRVVEELGDWSCVDTTDLEALHDDVPTWPPDPRSELPSSISDALSDGGEIVVRYTNGNANESRRLIRPLACFSVDDYVYVRAYCTKARDMRTFRLDRILAVEPT